MDHPNQEGTLAAGGATNPGSDGQFDHMAPWESLGPAAYEVPSNSWEDQCLKQATLVQTMTRSQIRRLVHCPLPQVGPRVPHPTPAPTVEEIFAESARRFPDNRTWFSGSPSSYSGAPRNQWGSSFG